MQWSFFFFCLVTRLSRGRLFKFDSPLYTYHVQLRNTKYTPRSVTTVVGEIDVLPTSSCQRHRDGVVDVASFDVASQGPRGVRPRCSRQHHLQVRPANCNSVAWKPGKTTRRVTSIDREPSAPRSVATPTSQPASQSQPAGGSLRSTFRARTEFVRPGEG